MRVRNRERFPDKESWEKEVDRIKKLYEQTFDTAKPKPGEFIWKELGEEKPPEVVIVGFLPRASKENSEGINQGFFERMEGAGIPRILRFLSNKGFSVAGTRLVLDDDNSLKKLLAVLKDKLTVKFVGMSSFTCEIDFATKVAKAIREVRPDIKLVLGGPHADISNVSKKAVERFYDFSDGWGDDSELKRLQTYFDYVVAGSGETALRDLLHRYDMPAYIKAGSPERKKELAGYIPPLRVIDREAGIFPLFPGYTGLASFLGTEGCPYKCSFCTSPLTSERKCQERRKDIPKLVEEIKRHPANMIWLDSETILTGWLRDFANEMIRQNVGKKWQFMPRVSSFLDEKTAKDNLALLKKSGCLQMVFGVESPDPKISASYNKAIGENAANCVLQRVSDAGIIPRAFLVIGGRYETEESLAHIIEWAKKSPALAFRISFITPFRGTPEWFKAEKADLWIDDEAKKYVHHTTLEPVVKCPAIIDENGELDGQKLEAFRNFPAQALTSIYNSPEYHQRIIDFVEKHPDMALVIRGMLYLFERQRFVSPDAFDRDFKTVLFSRK